MKEKIELSNEMETLLIPLYGRYRMSKEGIFEDKYAEETVELIQYDFQRLHIPKKIQVFMAIRGGLMDDYTKEFLKENPNSIVISMGSGLDARYARVHGYGQWIDLDFPQVIELREKLLPDRENHSNIGSSVTEWSWIDQIEKTDHKVLMIAEGLLMYLAQDDIKLLFDKLNAKCPNATWIFDSYSRMTVKQIKKQESLKKTGASIQWGIDSPAEVETMSKKMKYHKTIYLTDEKYVNRLGGFYTFMFKIAGKFKVAIEAHRIMIFHVV